MVLIRRKGKIPSTSGCFRNKGRILPAVALCLVLMLCAVSPARGETVGNIWELYEILRETAENGDDTFGFTCTKGVYDLWAEDDFRSRLMTSLGLIGYQGLLTMTGGGYRIDAEQLEYIPGAKIWAYDRTGRADLLSVRERKTLAVAREIAQSAEGRAQEKERTIHDALCARIRYVNDGIEGNDDDCAIGALLNGEANCDGYSDAFFLVGRLAGLEVYYFAGDAILTSEEDTGHMWNLIQIRRQWVMVDVTWDDTVASGSEDGEGCTHYWFNRGTETMSLDHMWPETAEEWVTLCEEDWPELRAEGFFDIGCETVAETVSLINSLAEQSQEEIAIRMEGDLAERLLGDGQQGLQEMLCLTSLAAPFSCTYSRASNLLFLRSPVFAHDLIPVSDAVEFRRELDRCLPSRPETVKFILAGDFDWQEMLQDVPERYRIRSLSYSIYGGRRLTLSEITY